MEGLEPRQLPGFCFVLDSMGQLCDTAPMKNALFGLARFLLTPIAFLGLRIFKPTKVNFYLKSGQVVIIRCDDYKFTYGKNGEITHYNVKGCFPDAVIPVTEIAAVTLEG